MSRPRGSDAAAMRQSALAAFERGDDSEALRHCRTLLGRMPTDRDALMLRTNLAIRADDLDAGIEALSTLIRAHGDRTDWRRQLSRLFNRRGARQRRSAASDAARADFQQALRLDSGNTDAWFNLALCERDAGDGAAAARALTELLRRQPGDEDAHLLGAQLLRTRNPPACVAQLAQLRRPEFANDALAIAAELDRAGDDHARSAFGEVLRLAGGKRAAPLLRAELGQALSLPAVVDRREQLEAARSRFAEGLSALEARWDDDYLARCEASLEQLVWCNFKLAYQGQDDVELQSRYGDLLDRALRRWFPDWCEPPAAARSGPLRIGLLSSCWRDCTTGHYFGGWIDWLTTAGHAVHLYQLGPTRDAHTAMLATKATRFHFHDGDLASLVEQLRNDHLHLLIYPEIGMDARLLPLAGLRLARRQVAAWGHPVSTGLPGIDAFFSCAAMEPEHAPEHYREDLLLLPGMGVHYPLPDASDGNAPALPDGPRLLLPHSLFKLHPDNDAVIADIAAGCPDARFLLFREQHPDWNRIVAARLQRAFAQRGLSPEARLHWLPALRRADYLAVNRESQLMLDALHWSGGNTSLDALAVGLPIITSRGQFMRGRQSAAMMETLGLADCVAPADQLAGRVVERLADQVGLRVTRECIAGNRDRLFGNDIARDAFLAHVERLAGDA